MRINAYLLLLLFLLVSCENQFKFTKSNTIVSNTGPQSPLVSHYGGHVFGDVVVKDNIAYVTDDEDGIKIFNVSNPASPTLISSTTTWQWSLAQNVEALTAAPIYGGFPRAVTIEGNHLFVTTSSAAEGLQIYDVSNVLYPRKISSVATGTDAKQTKISGNFAFIANNTLGLMIVDISDRTKPAIVSEIDTTGTALTVDVQGDYAYVADNLSGLKIFDVSDPTLPVLIATVPVNGSGKAVGITVDGIHAYLSELDYGLKILDISTPTTPVLLSASTAHNKARHASVSGNKLFLSQDSTTFKIIDITDPSAPTVDVVVPVATLNLTKKTFVVGNTLYTAQGMFGMRILDIQNTASPAILGQYFINTEMVGMCINGDFAYITDASLRRIHVVNIASPQSPQAVSSLVLPDEIRDLSCQGNYIYAAVVASGLKVIDISNPATITEVASITGIGSVAKVLPVGSTLYIQSSTALHRVDISNPVSPTLEYSFAGGAIPVAANNNSSTVAKMKVVGDYLYIPQGTVGLRILDISQPTNFSITTTLPIAQAMGLDIIENYLYVADFTRKLIIVDITDPSAATIIKSITVPGQSQMLYIDGQRLISASYYSGVEVFDITDRENPLRTDIYSASSHGAVTRFLVKKGPYYYVTAHRSGLLVLDSRLLR